MVIAQVDGLAGVADDLGERIAEEGKIIRLLGAQPFGVRAVEGEARLIVELCRDVFFLFPVVVQMLDDLLLHWRQPFAVRVQPGHEGGEALGMRQPEMPVG